MASIAERAQEIWPNLPKTPITLDDSTRELYNRAINEPTSLTDDERRVITRRPTGPEEDQLCRDACGMTFSELARKWPAPSQTAHEINFSARLGEADRELWRNAYNAAWSEDMKTARANARAITKPVKADYSAARKSHNSDDWRNIAYAMKIPWQEYVISDPANTVFGFVFFVPHAIGSEWPLFKAQIEIATRHGLNCHLPPTRKEDLPKFTLHWIEEDAADMESTFVSKRGNGELPKGLRTDSFLYVDEESLRSHSLERPFIWLWEPENTISKELGPLKVDIKHIVPLLFARLTQRDLPEEQRHKPYRKPSDFATLHQIAQYKDPTNQRIDGIWPAPARIM
ncbi:unnamed protein product [Penicillium pancosmium]